MIPERYTLNQSSFAHYWQHGVGKDLLLQLPQKPPLEMANSWVPDLYHYDEAADAIIRELYLPMGFKEGHRVVQQYLDRQELPVARHSILLERFFSEYETIPHWVSQDRLNAGAAFCRRAGVPALIVLRDYCLMGGYESSAINKPLIFTGALKKGAAKRLTETVGFWVAATRKDAFQNGHSGFKSVMTTRMIHAYSRVRILEQKEWEAQKWGVPLNHWDMLATQLGFSLVFLTGLRKMGFQPTEAEVDGLFHLWKYIGYLLGIPLDRLPNNETEAITALYYWTMTQAPGDADSKALAQALLNESLRVRFPRYHWQRKLLKELHLFYNHFFLGPYSCNLLGLPKTRWGQLAQIKLWQIKKKEKKMSHTVFREKAIEKGGQQQQEVQRIYETYNYDC